MKMTQAVGLADDAGKLAQRLGHEPGLEAHVGIAHVPFDLRLGDQGRHRVDYQHVDGAAAHQRLGDFQGLFAGIGLGDEQIVGSDAELPGVADVEGVLGIDESGDPAQFLGFGDDMQRQGRLAR